MGYCRLTLSRHETQLFRSTTPHETPRASADAHGQRTLLHKSDTGGDADTQSARREKLYSPAFCEVSCSMNSHYTENHTR